MGSVPNRRPGVVLPPLAAWPAVTSLLPGVGGATVDIGREVSVARADLAATPERSSTDRETAVVLPVGRHRCEIIYG